MDALRAVDIVQAARRAASATGPPVTFEAHSTVIALGTSRSEEGKQKQTAMKQPVHQLLCAR